MKVILLGALVIAPLLSFAGPATQNDPRCRADVRDGFDEGWRMSAGSNQFRGQCVNARSVRPPVLLKKSDGEIQFANFYHDGRFWRAHWDRRDSPRVSFMIIHFSGGLGVVKPAHTEFLFQFPRGLKLVSQTLPSRTTNVREVSVSWEAVFVPGSGYNALVGLNDNYPIAGRVTSLAARIEENHPSGEPYRTTERYPLRLTAEESRYVFLQSVLQSAELGYSQFYNSLRPNCTTKPFDVLDLILSRTRPALILNSFITEWSPDPIIGPVKRALAQRGLIAPGKPSLDFKAERDLH